MRSEGGGRLAKWAAGAVAPLVLAGALLPLHDSVNLVSDALLFLAVAVAIAVWAGLVPSLVAAVEGALLLNFFFTAPVPPSPWRTRTTQWRWRSSSV